MTEQDAAASALYCAESALASVMQERDRLRVALREVQAANTALLERARRAEAARDALARRVAR